MSDKYKEELLEREFIGYGLNPPDPAWPGGAKVCVSFVVQYNMGAESNMLDGDAHSVGEYLEIPSMTSFPRRVETTEMFYEFGAREGVPRLLKLFSRYNMPVTWNVYTSALEKAQYWLKPIMASGAELSCGGHRYKDQFDVPPEEEAASIEKSIDVLQGLTGDKTLPHGWLVERRSNLSVKLYALAHESRGMPLYSSDSNADDLPYWVPSPAKNGGLLLVPFSHDCSDFRFNAKGSGWSSPKDYFLHLRDTFDCLYEEGEAGEAKMMTVLLHPHIIGHAGRLHWLEEFVKHVASKPDVWVARRRDIAQHWTAQFPYDPATAFGQTVPPACVPV